MLISSTAMRTLIAVDAPVSSNQASQNPTPIPALQTQSAMHWAELTHPVFVALQLQGRQFTGGGGRSSSARATFEVARLPATMRRLKQLEAHPVNASKLFMKDSFVWEDDTPTQKRENRGNSRTGLSFQSATQIL
jgi:hypothetical protein